MLAHRANILAVFPMTGPPHFDPALAVQGHRKLVLTKLMWRYPLWWIERCWFTALSTAPQIIRNC